MSELYERDFCAWAMRNAELMRRGHLSEIDVEHIAEELESMTRSEKRELVNRLAVLIAHLLKWHHQPMIRSKSWKYSVRAQRMEVRDLLEESPSLTYQIDEKIRRAYEKAVIIAAQQTGLADEVFSSQCPYSFAEIMNENYWPE